MICDECRHIKSCIFVKLGHKALSSLAPFLQPIRLEPRAPNVSVEIPPMAGFYIVCKGLSFVVMALPEGKRLIPQILSEGDMLGFSLDSQGRYNVYLEALTPSQLVFINDQDFQELLKRQPSLGFQVIHKIREQVRSLQWDLLKAAYQGSNVRVASLILKLHELGLLTKIPFRQERLAEMVGISREMFNKHANELINRRIILVEHHIISIVDLETLEALARDGAPL